jgi:two-component system sporulation sensor kinase B
MEITTHFLINLFFLIVFLFFCFVFYEKGRNFLNSKLSFNFICYIALWTSMQFAYHADGGAMYDLRIIPLVIGGLYLGIGPLIAGAVIIIRAFLGIDSGFYETAAFYIPLAFFFWRQYPRFSVIGPKKRIVYAVSVGLVISLITVLGMEFIHTRIFWLDAWFGFLTIPPLGIGIIAYMIEFVRRNIQMKHQLIKTEKLQAVEQMGAAISHEIRNPLTAATGFVQLLQDDYLPKYKQKEYLALVKEELMAAERVIQDYLTFAKPSITSMEELNVKTELLQAIKILQPMANQNSVEITTDFSAVGFILGDKQKFRQCFVNVIKNAIESMPSGGYLKIGTEFSKNTVAIEITDTGVGMAKDQLEKLGEPYYSTKGSKGTGLGMMVVFSIVRALNGSIKVDSELGKGTRFTFKFPSSRSTYINK